LAHIQIHDARKLLKIISSTVAKQQTLTYPSAAKIMGRPATHSRAMASTCNLLDAAACLAGVPLLALIAVRAKSKKINPAAFRKEFSEYQRNAIIKRSLDHQFSPGDSKAILNGLDDLGDRGAQKAWEFLEKVLYPGDLFYRRLVGDYAAPNIDAINDIGTDEPDRIKSESWSYARNPAVRDAILKRANGHCEFCGTLGFMKPDGSRYIEAHHVIALANDGEDRVTNVIGLCPNDHREAHFGTESEEIEAKMITILKRMNLPTKTAGGCRGSKVEK
jgi:hypothetical protein